MYILFEKKHFFCMSCIYTYISAWEVDVMKMKASRVNYSWFDSNELSSEQWIFGVYVV